MPLYLQEAPLALLVLQFQGPLYCPKIVLGREKNFLILEEYFRQETDQFCIYQGSGSSGHNPPEDLEAGLFPLSGVALQGWHSSNSNASPSMGLSFTYLGGSTALLQGVRGSQPPLCTSLLLQKALHLKALSTENRKCSYWRKELFTGEPAPCRRPVLGPSKKKAPWQQCHPPFCPCPGLGR